MDTPAKKNDGIETTGDEKAEATVKQTKDEPYAQLENMPSFQEMQKIQEEQIKEQSDHQAIDLTDLEFQKMLESVSSPEEKAKTLTFENMSKLSTEQYIQLWQKLNPFYVAHITRQGVRDHVGMIYHSAGSGKLHNGFKDTLKDGKTLRSPAEVRYGVKPDFKREDVERLIDKLVSEEDLKTKSVRQIINGLPVNSGLGAADPWADRNAIHFAQHTVLNELYGGETGNEIFFIYPTDVIASQCKFGGHMVNLTTAQVKNERKGNDIFIWPQNGNIPIDAGLVFIPGDAAVDPQTGSIYDTDEKGNIETDEIRVQRFTEWMKSLSIDSAEIIDADNDNLDTIKNKLKEIGIPEDKISGMVEYGNYYSFRRFIENGTFSNLYLSEEEKAKMSPSEMSDLSCRNFLIDNNAHFKFAKNPIKSQDYWEAYFTDHPEEKPAHIIYYPGDPSKAVRSFLKSNSILEENPYSFDDQMQNITGPSDTAARDGDFLGFDKNFIADGTNDEKMNAEHERFNRLAEEIILEKQAQLKKDHE